MRIVRKKNVLANVFVACLMVSGFANATDTVNYLVLSDMARPFQIEDNDVSQGGIITEIIESVFKEADYIVKTKVFPLSRLHHEVKNKRVTNWISYDAKEWNSFGEDGEIIDIPLFEVTHDILTCDNSIISINRDSDLQGRSFAILEDFSYLRLEELAKLGKVTLVPVKGYESGILMSNKKRVQGFVEMSLRLKYNVDVLGKADDCQRYVNFSHVIPPYSIYFAVDKNMPTETKQFMSGRLQSMQNSGELKEIFNRWNKY